MDEDVHRFQGAPSLWSPCCLYPAYCGYIHRYREGLEFQHLYQNRVREAIRLPVFYEYGRSGHK
ncbi:hypothetical protein D3C81_1730430 [compost metagenome]